MTLMPITPSRIVLPRSLFAIRFGTMAWRFGLRAGKLQMGIDVLIVLGAVMVVPLDKMALSILGALALNMVLAINHRAGRYMGVS